MTQPSDKVIDLGRGDFVNYPAPLKIQAQFKILRILYLQHDANFEDLKPLDSYIINEDWEVKRIVAENITQFNLPKDVTKQLIKFSKVVDEEIHVMRQFLFEFSMEVKSCLGFIWTGWGTVNRTETIKKFMLQDKKLGNKNKFTICAHFCFENEIENIWKSLGYYDKKYLLRSFPRTMESIWGALILLKKNSADLPLLKGFEDEFKEVDVNYLYETGFVLCMSNGLTEAGTRYFFNRLDSKKRESLVFENIENLAPRGYGRLEETYVFFYLFFNTDNKNFLNKIRRDMDTSLFSLWPWKFFLDFSFLEKFFFGAKFDSESESESKPESEASDLDIDLGSDLDLD